MRKVFLAITLAIGVVAVGFVYAREQGKSAAPSAEEQAIRGVVDAFAKAFDKHDAEAIAKLFIPDGKLVTEDGSVIEGRKDIAATFAEMFSANPEAKIEVHVDAIRLLGSELAVEVGQTKMTPASNETPIVDRYTVIHVKRDGKWWMALARDSEGEAPTPHQRLQPLAWLVGEWIDESPEAVVSTSCKWSADKNFLMQDIQVKSAGKTAMTIQQRIGWDPVHNCVRSWVFDSEGGFGESLWTDAGDHWVIKATGVQPGGATGSATNIITRTGPDSYHWQSTHRVIGHQLVDPIEVRVVRKPPTAGGAK